MPFPPPTQLPPAQLPPFRPPAVGEKPRLFAAIMVAVAIGALFIMPLTRDWALNRLGF